MFDEERLKKVVEASNKDQKEVMDKVKGLECQTCGGKYPDCICHGKNKMPVWVTI